MDINNLFYSRVERRRPERPRTLPSARTADLLRPEDYVADAGLVDAINVALLLGQPLLLTGEPGTGKTQLAYSLAWQLGFDAPLKFETRSTSTARDLFYTYDALGRFQAGQSGAAADPRDYMTYNALGLAILRAAEPESVASLLPPGFELGPRGRSVVLIDEVDKAPRDFANDLLNELEGMYFRVPELGNATALADAESRPVVILTSNSEKDLPDAFLRRCLFYDIPFPDPEDLERIVSLRLEAYGGAGSGLLKDALTIFSELRQRGSGLRKLPATAELLGWLVTLRELGGDAENPLADDPELALRTLTNLVKTAEDQAKAKLVVEAWIQSRR
jgi:MoxR-like ATPase